VERISGPPLPSNKPFVGEYAFADESDVHVAAQLKKSFAFQGIQPQALGNKRRFVLGKHSEKNVLRYKLRELGSKAPEEKYPLLLERVREWSERKKGVVPTDEDIKEMVLQ
jgi:isopropylmalate/homocitrate/citramalate synthase